MDLLLAAFEQSAAIRLLVQRVQSSHAASVSGLNGSAVALLAAALSRQFHRHVLVVTADEAVRDAVHSDLQVLLGRTKARMLMSDGQSQLRFLNALNTGQELVVVCHAATLQSRAVQVARRDALELAIRVGDSLSREALLEWLAAAGFEASDLVSESGEFARRGGIVDVFAEGESFPVRIEFMGDRVESMRAFDPLTQRSARAVDSARFEARAARRLSDAPVQSLLPPDVFLLEMVPTGISPAYRVTVVEDAADVELGFRKPGIYLGNFELLKSEYARTGLVYYIACADGQQQERLSRLLGEEPVYLQGRLSQGFVAANEGFALLTEKEIYGVPVMREARHKFKGLPVDDLLALRKGDYVVHVSYGIGMFEGIKRLKVEGNEHDFLHIRYAENSKVYVPVENLGLLDRYIGAEDRAPALDRLGSKSWHLAKTRTATAVADYAEELLAIYARRQAVKGFAFSRDTPWQRELEESFIHEETPDQLKAINEAKRDMESSRPMDRLVCGDVGYGKTEVALRAAFKAVMDGKQVAVLAPTTILAYQHFNTFRERTARHPIRVAMLSRFVSPGERARALQQLKQGSVDIAIGTHMLLSKQVEFKDLGLLIIDEEQKFGVRQKEKIKKLKAGVDVLTLSATPIPRTLYMSLVGLRDISTIHTPPAGRREIMTQVEPWHEETIRRYIMREAERGGQVFFIHNRIESLKSVYHKLCRMCPELRIAMAHGQMPERSLANVYLGFAAGDYDMLVSTAIIESGLDLPRVNTIVVNRADWFGLADLHQLRGRVGRTQEQAYALFLVPDQHEVSDEARKRLSAILAYSQLGSGFKLAMRDMEIRGVGNLLGLEQHGHVARVGFNLYVQLLKEAVSKLKGEEIIPEPELKIDVEAYLPEDYVTDSFERVAIYKRLLSAESEIELDSLREELRDRFGRYPRIVECLLKVALARVRARKARLLRVMLKGTRISLVATKGESVIEGGLDRLLEVLKD